MKFNKLRQFAQVVLFSLMALGAGSAFAQAERAALGLPSPSSQADIKMEAQGQKDSENDQKAMGSRTCVGRFQTGTTWQTPGTILPPPYNSYNLGNVSTPNAEGKCRTKNETYSHPLTGSQVVANAACAAGALDNDFVRSFSKAGLIASGGQDHLIGILDRGAAVYNCPQGGSLNGSNCVQTVAATCPAGFSISGGNCVKTYAANVVTPAFCKFLP